MSDKYVRVSVHQSSPPMLPNEVRITKDGPRKAYISYAISKLTEGSSPSSSVLLRAMGSATGKAVTIAEIIKRRVVGLHQSTKIDATIVNDVFEPLEEGLKTVTIQRRVSNIEILLTKNASEAQPGSSGYQPPIPEDQVEPQKKELVERSGFFRGGRGGFRGRGGRGRGRGGRGGGASQSNGGGGDETSRGEFSSAPVDDEGNPIRGRGGRGGRGRGRGRGGRGGRGGNFSSQNNSATENSTTTSQTTTTTNNNNTNNNNQSVTASSPSSSSAADSGRGGRGGRGGGGGGRGNGRGGRGGRGGNSRGQSSPQ